MVEKALGHYDQARSTEYGTPTVDLHDQIPHSGPRKAWTMRVEHQDIASNRIIRIGGFMYVHPSYEFHMWCVLAWTNSVATNLSNGRDTDLNHYH